MWKFNGYYFGDDLAYKDVLTVLEEHGIATEENIEFVIWTFKNRKPWKGWSLYDYLEDIVEDEFLENTIYCGEDE